MLSIASSPSIRITVIVPVVAIHLSGIRRLITGCVIAQVEPGEQRFPPGWLRDLRDDVDVLLHPQMRDEVAGRPGAVRGEQYHLGRVDIVGGVDLPADPTGQQWRDRGERADPVHGLASGTGLDLRVVIAVDSELEIGAAPAFRNNCAGVTDWILGRRLGAGTIVVPDRIVSCRLDTDCRMTPCGWVFVEQLPIFLGGGSGRWCDLSRELRGPADGLLQVINFEPLDCRSGAPGAQSYPESFRCVGAFLASDHLDERRRLLIEPLDLAAVTLEEGDTDLPVPPSTDLQRGAEPLGERPVLPLHPHAERIGGPKVPVWPDGGEAIKRKFMIVAVVHQFQGEGDHERVRRRGFDRFPNPRHESLWNADPDWGCRSPVSNAMTRELTQRSLLVSDVEAQCKRA